MSTGEKSALLERINTVLDQHPANEHGCGEKRSCLEVRDGERLSCMVSFTEAPRQYRFEVPLAKLDFAQMGVDVEPGSRRGQVYVPCVGDEKVSRWWIRDTPDGDWRVVRDDPEFVIDLAPDKNAADQVCALLREWAG